MGGIAIGIRSVSIAFASALLGTIVATAAPADRQAIDMVFRVDGRTVVLADDVRDELRDRADGIVRRCGYDGGDQEQRIWTEALAASSFIRLTYAMPIELRLPRREILISEAVFLLRDTNFLEQPVLRATTNGRHSSSNATARTCSGSCACRRWLPTSRPAIRATAISYERSEVLRSGA